MAHTITITGCGTSAYNATYTYTGTQNSRPYWANSTTSYIYSIQDFMGTNYWVVSDALTDNPGLFDSHSCYALESDANVPPKFGLVAVNGATAGDPVLAALEEAISITGAGTSAVNDRFVWVQMTNSRPAYLTASGNHNIAYDGTDWEIREGVTVLYTNTDDGETVPTSGWTVGTGSAPAPSGFTTETLSLGESEVVRTDETVTASDFAVVGGSGEALHEIIGRDISYPSDPAGDEPYIAPATPPDNTGQWKFAMPEGMHQLLEIRHRLRARNSSGDILKSVFEAGGNSSASVTTRNSTSFGWGGEVTYNASTNTGSLVFPIAGADAEELTFSLKEAGSASVMDVQLVYVEIDYTYWESAADTTAPTLTSATIGTNGTTFTMVFNENVNLGTGDDDSDWTLNASDGTATLTYSSGDGTDTLVYTISRTIQDDETVTLDYTQPGDGIEDDAGNDLATFSATAVTNNSTQTNVAPVLTSAGYSTVGSTTADGDVTTNEDNGTLYAVVTVSGTAPSAAQVKAGQDNGGSAATFDDSQAISSVGAKQFNATGLTESTSYYWHFMHEDEDTNQSAVVSSGQFTTTSGAAVLQAMHHYRMMVNS